MITAHSPAVVLRSIGVRFLAVALAASPAAVRAQSETAGGAGAEKTPPTASPAPAAPDAGTAQVENSVVKVFSTMRAPDIVKPWTKQAPREVTGSGVVIEGKRILTNAHIVLYASQVQIQGNQAGDKISASVEFIAPGIDLAVLKLDDETFFATHAALSHANNLPQVKDAVMTYGYPTGGTTLSITKGIVSRIEFTGYNFPVAGLRIQIDAAINAGNSGGPAVAGDKMIGLAFSRLGGGAENIGYIIPCEEIELFLQDIADGRYDGKPGLFDGCQTLENPALRAYLKLDKAVTGVVVHEPYLDDAAYPLKEWDVITAIGGMPVDDQGKVKVRDDLRLQFTYLVQKTARNGKVALTVVRGAREMKIELPVSPVRAKLIPFLQGAYPPYFVYGSLAFSVATEELLLGLSSGANAARFTTVLSYRGSPLLTRRGDKPAFPGEELVIVPSPFFPHKVSTGYANPTVGQVVKSVNGIAIKNLQHLVAVLRDAKEEFLVIEFADREVESLVLPRTEMVKATDDILNDNGIRSQGTPDTLAVWNAKPRK
jgi:S1-C subfamily serine protease